MLSPYMLAKKVPTDSQAVHSKSHEITLDTTIFPVTSSDIQWLVVPVYPINPSSSPSNISLSHHEVSLDPPKIAFKHHLLLTFEP